MLQEKSKQNAFSLPKMLFLHLSKKPKPTKRSQQKNKPIKCSHVEKNDSKLLEEKLKHLFLPLHYNWLFKWLFSIGVYILKIAIFILFKIPFYQFGSSK